MFEEFPFEEYQSRLQATRRAMTEYKLDALITTTECNCRYLVGMANNYWPATMGDDIQAALVPADESADLVLLLPDHLCHGIAKSSWVKDRRAWSQFSVGLMPGPIKTIADTVAEKGLDRARIGLEIGVNARLGMSPAYYQKLREALPNCEFVDCDEMMARVRTIKTPAEMECIRRSCEINSEGLIAGLAAVAEGVSERQIAQAIAKRYSEVTDVFSSYIPWFMHVYSSPHRNQWFDCGPTEYCLQKGDYVVMDIGYCYKGYWSDMFRTACIGKPDPVVEKIFNANRLGNLAGTEKIAPGVPVSEIALTVHKKWKELGLEAELKEQVVDNDYDFIGHGGGLCLHDYPLINTQQTDKLQSGMYLMMEAMLTDHMPFDKAKACVGIEDGILVTDNGYERMTEMVPDELLIK